MIMIIQKELSYDGLLHGTSEMLFLAYFVIFFFWKNQSNRYGTLLTHENDCDLRIYQLIISENPGIIYSLD